MELVPLIGSDDAEQQTGATCVVVLDDLTDVVTTKGKTIIVKPGGAGFHAIAIQGLTLPDDSEENNWERALGREVDGQGRNVHLVVDPIRPAPYQLDAGYRAVRVTGTGGDFTSTLEAAFMV